MTDFITASVDSPELEERGDRQWLVFYPFVVEQVVDVGVEVG